MQSMSNEILTHFENVTDPRINRGNNHPLLELVFMALTSHLCGCNDWASIARFVEDKKSWFAKYLEMPFGVPSDDTFRRVFARLDTAQFLVAMHQWVDVFAGSLRGQGVAIDGKVLRGSFDKASGQSPLHTITAFATATRICLRQATVDGKSNEIPAVPEMLKLLDLNGAIVSLDAMHCQTATAAAIVDAKADYILAAKNNQPKLFEFLHDLFEKALEDGSKVKTYRYVECDKAHGREERREYITLKAPVCQELVKWTNLKSITMTYRTSKEKRSGKERENVMFYISSCPPKVKSLARHIRGHWAIENSLHHVLDVTFTEDSSRIRKGSGPEVAACLRRMAANILQLDTTINDNIRGKRMRLGWSEQRLDQLYAGFLSS
jgi:predicted transposase YbfD/YdcC